VERVIATGSSAKRVAFANGTVPDAAADARGVIKLIPTARTVINVGAEECRSIKVSAEGKVLDFAMNEKCAAGTGNLCRSHVQGTRSSVDEMSEITLHPPRPFRPMPSAQFSANPRWFHSSTRKPQNRISQGLS